MPESPEVQAFADTVSSLVVGRRVRSVEGTDNRIVQTRWRPPTSLVGGVVVAVVRHGKMVDIAVRDAEGGAVHLVVSFGRHGWGRWHDVIPAAPPAAPAVLRLVLDDGALDIVDDGSFRSVAVWVVDRPTDVVAIAGLGPDPARGGFAQVDLDRAVVRRRKQIKAVLQEQGSFAGIGNAYSDEILYAARVRPTAHALLLDEAARARLHAAMVEVVGGAVRDRAGIDLVDLKAAKIGAMRVHGRAGEECPRCGRVFEDFSFAGTTAQYCPGCQAEPVTPDSSRSS